MQTKALLVHQIMINQQVCSSMRMYRYVLSGLRNLSKVGRKERDQPPTI